MGCGPSAVAELPWGLAATSQRWQRRVPESLRFGPERDGISAPFAVDMRAGPLAARWLSAWNGYGAAQHVR